MLDYYIMQSIKQDDLKKEMKTNNTYPIPSTDNYQKEIYEKREFYIHKFPKRGELLKYDDIKEYRDKMCSRAFSLFRQQSFLSSMINLNTPYKGMLVFHGTGTGKCLTEDSLIYVNGTLIPIGKIWSKYHDPTKLVYDDLGTWSLPTKKLYVNSFNEKTLSIVKRPVKRLYRQYIREPINIIELENGTTLKITKKHKLYTENGWTHNFHHSSYILIPTRLIPKGKNKNLDIDRNFSALTKIPNKIMRGVITEIITFVRNYLNECAEFCDNVIILSKNTLLLKQIQTLLKFVGVQMVLRDDKGYIESNDLIHYINKIGVEQHYYLHYTNNIKLKENDFLLGDFEFIKIKSIRECFYDAFVYDLEIKKYHNYIAENALVSNTCAGIAIAETLKPMFQKYNTKAHVLVSGPIIKENWKSEILTCTGETYLKKTDASRILSKEEIKKQEKEAINNAMQYYRFMSYRSFYRKVLGEKIVERVKTDDDKIKLTYRKTKEGDFERDIAIDRIYNLDNSLIIVDEAHHLTGNAYGESLMKIIKNSYNLKVVLLTATPMKNLADDIIQLLNFIRPPDAPLEREKIFNNPKNSHLLKFKEGGEDYLAKMCKGYVSYLRGADPITFARRIDKGEIPPGLLFTKVVRCKMEPFQQQIYNEALTLQQTSSDSLDRKSEAVSNFAFPGLDTNKKQITGYYGLEGINIIKEQLKSHSVFLNKKIGEDILKVDEDEMEGEFLYTTDAGKVVTGNILNMRYLKNFSIKFYKALKKINRLFWGKKGARTAFIYSNLVRVGIDLFKEILIQNGYLEYNEDPSTYKISSNTICYFCGRDYEKHLQDKLVKKSHQKRIDKSRSSTEYELNRGEPPYHNFHPAVFISVTGRSSEEMVDTDPEDKLKMLRSVFNHIDNKEGKYIKLVLGSRVMNEGVTLKNVSEVHILDVYFNLGRIDQVIGRAIRNCSHYAITNDKNRFPSVKVYKYTVSTDKELTTEEELYKKAEKKYLLIKKTERILKEVAVDCPLNLSANIFPEEVTKYTDCVEPEKEGKLKCPSLCDYTNCEFTCRENALNKLYWDNENKVYKSIDKENLDYSTFTPDLARAEIDKVKKIIKDMYKIEYVYTIEDILENVKNFYKDEYKKLFDEFFCFKALDELIPITENEFNNYKDTIFDKFNKAGYLIYIKKYYIFQPFEQKENVPMYYRTLHEGLKSENNAGLYNYLKDMDEYNINIDEDEKKEVDVEYQFDKYYYDNREEYKYVGFVDKESSRGKGKQIEELKDVFKFRQKRKKILEKKRGTGIQTFKGAVCLTRDKTYLKKVCKDLEVDVKGINTKDALCSKIQEKLLELEKYSTGKDKMTYVYIPSNHKTLPFPYNLEDRVKYIIDEIKENIKFKLDMSVKKNKKEDKYVIIIKDSKNLADFSNFLKKIKGKLVKNEWVIEIE